MPLTAEDILLGPERECRGCGVHFRTLDPRQSLCGKPMCYQGKRQARRAAHEVDFIGIDGEGVGSGKKHRYVLIGCGPGQLATDDERGFWWEPVMEFLYDGFRESPRAAFVGFFLGYDFCQWFKSLPENRARMLWTPEGVARRKRQRSGGNPIPFPVSVRGRDSEWEIDALGMRRIKLRPAGETGWMYVCDAGPFFQTSFLNVIKPSKWKEPVVSQAEYDLISEGKEARGDQVEVTPDMRKYMGLEIDVLARVMRRLNEGFVKAGVRLSRQQWYGPGQAAQAWMRQADVPKRSQLSEGSKRPVPDYAFKSAQRSYFGGWFELFMHGYIPGPMYAYDINSAYPSVIAKLPCLLHGSWKHTRYHGEPGDWASLMDSEPRYCLVHAEVSGSDSYVGCMLHRTKTGTIRRPYHTGGWYWVHELSAAQRAGLVNHVAITESVEYRPCSCLPPVRGIAGLYDGRARVGNASSEGKALKLLYNSEYGKFAQSVGDPMFANPIYASLITAGCRTQILEAIASHPKGTSDVAMVATDAVYFRSPHPGLTIGKGLGEWGETVHQNMTLFKPGVYWDDEAREALRANESPAFKARGVNAKALSRKLLEIDEAFQGWQIAPHILPAEPGRPDWPAVDFPLDFAMVTIGQALQWGHWFMAGQVSSNKVVNQDSNPDGKRTGQYMDDGICRTRPWARGNFGEDNQESAPYSKSFGMAPLMEITPDGGIIDLIGQAIGVNR